MGSAQQALHGNMSDYEAIDSKLILKRLALLLGVILVAAILGLGLARLVTRPQIPEAVELRRLATQREANPEHRESYRDPDAPPIYLFAGVSPEGDRSLALAEIAMAAGHGLHQYILPVNAPWDEGAGASLLLFLDQIAEADPLAAYYLQVNLNPPDEWLLRNPSEQVRLGTETRPFCSPSSVLWLGAARDALERLLSLVEESSHHGRLLGIVPAGLHNGQWHLGEPGYDVSTAALRGFQLWLRGIYVEESVLRIAWAQPNASFLSAPIPQQPPTNDTTKVFFALPQQQPQVDYLNFVSEATADALAALTTHIKSHTELPIKVLVPYGYTLEVPYNEGGHFSLSILAGSDVDGFISPVSYVDRGTGGAGGFMGPITTARYHGKEWLLVDDTRTGVARDAITGAVERLRGLRPEDVYSVQQRNFSAALAQGLGLVWSDPAGEGWLHDAGQWSQFQHLLEIYREVQEGKAADTEQEETSVPEDGEHTSPPVEAVSPPVQSEESPAPADSSPAVNDEDADTMEALESIAAMQEDAESAVQEEPYLAEQLTYDPDLPDVPYETGMMVVADEVSRFFLQCEAVNPVLLHANRDAAMRAGLPTQFALLQDVLEGKSPPAPVYLFLNVFYLPEDQRVVLHDRLAREQAAAIWIYAPGYVDEGMDTANVSATTGMNVVAFPAPEDAASLYALNGLWIKQGEAIGSTLMMQPLFHIEDPEADVPIAQYKTSGKMSAAMRYNPEGWTSVFVATPFLTPALLREILTVLEQPLVYRPKPINQFDTTHIADNLIAIHARQVGEREIELDGTYDVQDLFDPNIGWPRRESFIVPLDTGDSRLLQLKPPS